MPSAKRKDTPVPTKYVLKQVDESSSPAGAEEDGWYRYVIEGGRSQITGYTRGPRRDVNERLETILAGLNLRATGRSTAHRASQPRAARKAS